MVSVNFRVSTWSTCSLFLSLNFKSYTKSLVPVDVLFLTGVIVLIASVIHCICNDWLPGASSFTPSDGNV